MATIHTTCCVSGCREPAVEFAAPDVPYCSRHAARNRQATGDYMRSINEGAYRAAAAAERNAALVASAVLLGGGQANVGGEGDWDVVTLDDGRTVAIRSRRYRETTYGDVIFVRPGSPRFDELLAAATV